LTLFRIRVAELNIEVQNKYPYAEKFCREFFAEFDQADITVSVTDKELEEERAQDPYHSTDGYLECICIYRKIALELSRFNGMVFHASVVACDGEAYAFAAHSGTGKSTHTALWLSVFGERATIVNGDKPIFRLIDGKWHAFGTPWRGKEGLGGNGSAPLKSICFLERGKENVIAPLGDAEAVSRLFSQVLLPKDPVLAEQQLALLDALITSTPTYLLRCNMLPEAAIVAHRGMTGGE
jgi:hypothetical protein